HETGLPMHSFDAKYITGNKVIVKTLPDGTKFTTLDEVERTLSDKDLIICNTEEGMCIAGVFGGLKSGVTEETTDIFLEAACFNPTWVRKTARRHSLNTDSSFRFERGTNPNITTFVIKRAAMLVKELAGGTIEGEIRDIYPEKIKRPEVELTYEKLNSLVGKEIPKDAIRSILESLEIEIENEIETSLTLRIPTYRVDVTRDVDVIEDILRIYGYNNIEISDSLKSNLSYQTATDKKQKLQTLISEQLTANGFNEIMNNSLTKKSYYESSEEYPLKNNVTLLNPLSNDLGVMRQTLLFGGLESIQYNRNRKNTDTRFYEFGNCYYFDADKKKEGNILSEYSEESHLGLWISGNRTIKSWATEEENSTFFELKAHLENIFTRLGFTKNHLVYEPIQSEMYEAGLKIRTFKKELGSIGIVSKKILKTFDIDTEVFFAEINWEEMLNENENQTVQFTEISKFPSVSRDLALLVDKNISFAEIERVTFKTEKKLLKEMSLFDVYEGNKLPEGKKSYAVNFVLQDSEKTLTDKQIDAVMQKIFSNLEKELGAKLR
ncbi:MAG: phenylalanine--tRNA ligase subunit beta, partial [Dysgonamonadaceae bacterium]